MSERSGSVLLGAFIVGALVVAVAGALFFAGGGFGRDRARVVMAFDGSIRGLTVGAPIALRGATIGQVEKIDVILDADRGDVTMVVVAAIDTASMELRGAGALNAEVEEALVERGLRAQLNTQSLLTGLLYIQLDFFPESEALLTEIESPYPQIPTIPTELEQLRRSLESIDYAGFGEKLERIGAGLEALLDSEALRTLPGEFSRALDSVARAGDRLEVTLEENSQQLSDLLSGGTATLETLNTELPALTDSLSASLTTLNTALERADATLLELQTATAPDSSTRQQLGNALQELTLAARALRSLARSLEEQPQSLLRGRAEDEE